MRVCYPFVGDSIGGAQLSTLTLVRHLPPDIEPVIAVHTDGPLIKHLVKLDIPYSLLPVASIAGQRKNALGQLSALAQITPKVMRFLRDQKIDLVHTQDGRMHISWWPAARLLSVPHLWHQRTRYAASRLLDFMIERTRNIVAISETARKSLPDGPRKRALLVHNPVAVSSVDSDTKKTRAAILNELASGPEHSFDNPVLIASVGNLRAVKQPMLQAETVIAVAKRVGRPVCLVLFGEDRECWISRMRAVISESGTNVALVEMGFRHPVEEWLAGCDVLLAASDGDAFGRTLVEAMGVGVPVVAADAAGHTEIVSNQENGILAEAGSVAGLADGICKILDDKPLRTRMINAGRIRAGDFSPEKHVAQIVKLYGALNSHG
jgi:glycosyltransferase involved in cell wall biosynthesis